MIHIASLAAKRELLNLSSAQKFLPQGSALTQGLTWTEFFCPFCNKYVFGLQPMSLHTVLCFWLFPLSLNLHKRIACLKTGQIIQWQRGRVMLSSQWTKLSIRATLTFLFGMTVCYSLRYWPSWSSCHVRKWWRLRHNQGVRGLTGSVQKAAWNYESRDPSPGLCFVPDYQRGLRQCSWPVWAFVSSSVTWECWPGERNVTKFYWVAIPCKAWARHSLYYNCIYSFLNHSGPLYVSDCF